MKQQKLKTPKKSGNDSEDPSREDGVIIDEVDPLLQQPPSVSRAKVPDTMATIDDAGDDIMEFPEDPDSIKKFIASIVTGVPKPLMDEHTKELSMR